MKNKIFKAVPIIFVSLFFVIYFAPLIVMAIFSFNSSNNALMWTGFSMQHYIELFTNPIIREVIIFTLLIALGATFFSLIIGTLAAIGLTKAKKKTRDRLLKINNFPIINPEIITAIGLLLVFMAIGLERGALTLLLAHIAFCIPYVVINVYPKLKSLDDNIVDAAMDLGAKPKVAIFKVILPQIKVTLFAAGAIAFSMSFDDFVISHFTSGIRNNISTHIVAGLRQGTPLAFNALSVVIMMIIIVKVVVDIILKNIKKTEVKV